MNESGKGLEFKVGLFVLVGLAVLAVLVVQFGRVGEGFKTYYDLTVQFENASGLLKSSDVLMSGAKVGRVAGGLKLNPSGEGVVVPLRIFDHVKIPVGSKFMVGSSGLARRSLRHDLGAEGERKEFFRPGATVRGNAADRHGRSDHAGRRVDQGPTQYRAER
jgi:phospholipid/cholesterol/gamma-HCH transport system substrate-binding protein